MTWLCAIQSGARLRYMRAHTDKLIWWTVGDDPENGELFTDAEKDALQERMVGFWTPVIFKESPK